jgi:hypothetical protein
MESTSVHDYSSFVENELIGSVPIVYQSIQGLIRNEEELKNIPAFNSGYVKIYRSDKISFFPLHKNISKIYVK